MLSRILGLFRVILEAQILGGGALASAWLLAFAIPNTFRRILGEGALGNALVPFINHNIEEHGRKNTRYDLAAIFVLLSLLLVTISILISGIAWLALPYATAPRYRMMLQILPLLMPYTIFICLTGAFSSILATLRIFALPALTALLLNLSIIGCLLLIGYYSLDYDSNAQCVAHYVSPQVLNYLAGAVLLAGFIQLLIIVFIVYRKGMLPIITRQALRRREAIVTVTKLTIPAAISGGALQLSTLLDKGIASAIGPLAVPALAYSDRIVLLPVGVLGVTLGGILLSNMSSDVAKGNIASVVRTLEVSLKMMLFICIPIALFTILFRNNIISLLYYRGSFTAENANATAYAMLFYAAGIPFFVCLKLLTPAFNARKDMMTPFKITIICLVLNTLLNLILMVPLKQGGIALATVISSMVNNCLLLFLLRRSGINIKISPLIIAIGKSLLACGIALLVTFVLETYAMSSVDTTSVIPFRLIICGIGFFVTYPAILALLVRRNEFVIKTGDYVN
ncbi:MAG: murein biosynthesis integral membrane protein MurJ [Victivallaceae bacterium]|nr:murein biosynthesis integral membrane protein MurJ [Victivallaceae bacterium]